MPEPASREAAYITEFRRSTSTQAIHLGHLFAADSGGPESDDEMSDTTLPRFAQVPFPADGLVVAATADLHGNELRPYIAVDSDDSKNMFPTRISLQDPGSIPEDTELLLFAGCDPPYIYLILDCVSTWHG